MNGGTMKKRVISTAAIMMISASLLAGCNSTETSEPALLTEEQVSTATTAEDQKEPVTIKISSWRTEDAEAFSYLNEAFHEENPDINVEFEPIKNTEYDSQIKIALQSGEGGDIVYSRNYDAGSLLMEAGYLQELTTEMIPALAGANAGYLDAFTSDTGEIFALPGAKVIQGFMYNKKIFDQYNLTEPKTWDEFFEVCETLQANGVRPLAVNFKDGWTFAHRSFQILPSFIEGDPEQWRQDLIAGKVDFLDPAFVKHFEAINNMKNYFGKDYEGLGYVDAQQLFISEQAAMFPGGSFEVSYFTQTNPDLQLDVFATPNEDSNQITPVATIQSWGYSINKNTKNLEACITYLNWLTSAQAVSILTEKLPGMPPMVAEAVDVDDPLMKKWNGFTGENGDNIMIYWGVEALNAEQPGAQTLVVEAIQKMLTGSLTPEQAAQYVQDGMETWYTPFDKTN